jgi:hypothetical protein
MPQRTIFTKQIVARLLANGRRHQRGEKTDTPPIVKVFCPYGAATWLFTELDPEDGDTLYGLCDLGQGFPELGYCSRTEVEEMRVPVGKSKLPLERDAWFDAKHPISVYADAAHHNAAITEDADKLAAASERLKADQLTTT